MKKLFVFVAIVMVAWACGGGNSQGSTGAEPPQSMVADAPEDDGTGVGEVKTVALNDPLKAEMVARGKAIYEMKCSACHQLSEQRVVGPGWKGVTSRRKPEWIMNMITNVEIMLEKDAAAQALLEECLTRMPNQNASIGDARVLLEFMYSNDGKPVGN